MTLVVDHIPNLLGGVSQQPIEIRLRNTSEKEINTLPSLSSGITKRPPFRLSSVLYSGMDNSFTAKTHAFETSDGRRWTAALTRSGSTALTLTDIDDGEVIYVNLASDDGYISAQGGDISRAFQMMTIADTLFVLNKNIIPTSDPLIEDQTLTTDLGDVGTLPDANSYSAGTTAETGGIYWVVREVTEFSQLNSYDDYYEANGRYRTTKVWRNYAPSFAGSRSQPKRAATYWAKQAVHATNYSVTITFEDDTTASATFTTADTVDGSGNPIEINTDQIANAISGGLGASPHITTIRTGASVSISSNKDIKSITVEDGFGDTASTGYVDEVDDFSKLAPNEVDGRIVRIAGSVDTDRDDYYVVRKGDRYVETYAYGQGTKLSTQTMPAVIRYDGSTFSLDTQFEWEGRSVGDTESNPDPTFVGRRINFMFLARQRLGFLSDENIVFSEVGLFENFYRSTLVSLKETDRIDVASTDPRTSILTHAVAFDRDLVVFSPKVQFRVDLGDTLSQSTISIDPTTTYAAAKDCQPIGVGSTVLFAEEARTSRFSKIMEYYREPNADQDKAESVTDTIPTYIPAGVSDLIPMTNEDVVFVSTRNNTGEVYVYNYYWRGGQKALSSWRTWTISNAQNILSITSIDDDLIALILTEEGQVCVVRCNVEEGFVPSGLDFQPRLDMLEVNPTGTYSDVFDETYFTLAQNLGPGVEVEMVVTRPWNGFPANHRISAKSAFADGMVTFAGVVPMTDIVIGIKYTTELTPTTFLKRTQLQGGEIETGTGRLSLRRVHVGTKDTATFDLEVENTKYGSVKTLSYTGDDLENSVLQTNFDDLQRDHKASFSVRGNTRKQKLTLINSTPYPSAWTFIEWEGVYSPKARRI